MAPASESAAVAELTERAEACNRRGDFQQALRDYARLRTMIPGDPTPDILASGIHLDQAQYASAVNCLTRALTLAPRSADILRRRSRAYFVWGRLAPAQRDLEAAARLSPDEQSLREERLRLRLLTGRGPSLKALLGGLPSDAADYFRGYDACRRGRFVEAADYFRAAAGSPRADLAERAPFFAVVAQVLAELPAKPARARRELFITGLGARHPYHVTREVVEGIRGCDVLYCNLSDPVVNEFLGLFPIPVKTVVFRDLAQAEPCAHRVMAGFRRHRRVALVTRGNPVIYGRFAHYLAVFGAQRKIAVTSPPGISLAELFPTLIPWPLNSSYGLQVRDPRALDSIDRRLPLIIYSLGGNERHVAAELARRYPPGQPCFVMAGAGDDEYAPRRTTIKKLCPVLQSAGRTAVLMIPPAAGG